MEHLFETEFVDVNDTMLILMYEKEEEVEPHSSSIPSSNLSSGSKAVNWNRIALILV